MLERTRQHQIADPDSTSLPERAGDFLQRSAAGHDIVNNDDPTPGEIGLAAKRAPHGLRTLATAQTGQARRMAITQQDLRQMFQPKLASQGTGKLAGRIEATLPHARGMQRNRQDAVCVEQASFLLQQSYKQARQTEALTVFESQDHLAHRMRVLPYRPAGVERSRPALTASAQQTLSRNRQCTARAQTAPDPRQAWGTVRTQHGAGTRSAKEAGRRPERIQGTPANVRRRMEDAV